MFISIFVLTGCLSRQVKEVADWEDEVLIAEECGVDGLICCASDPKCKYGQVCCVNPTNDKKTYCAEECVCGELNKFCCSDNLSCNEGLVCLEGSCISCGKDGEFCCGNNSCEGDLLCSGGVCRPCGVEGGVCCVEEDPCSKEKEKNLECANNICEICGTAGNRPCATQPVCNVGNLLNNNSCIPCGKANNPCCNQEESDYECENNLKCDLGFCN